MSRWPNFARICQVEEGHASRLEGLDAQRMTNARNLLSYVALRQQDLRSLQNELTCRGLSSLGRCEANVHATLNAVIEILCRLADAPLPQLPETQLSFEHSRQLLSQTTEALFGPRPAVGGAHIMVTMPSEAATDRQLMRDLVAQGMDCIRINCAHDDAQAWYHMVENLRRAKSSRRESARS